MLLRDMVKGLGSKSKYMKTNDVAMKDKDTDWKVTYELNGTQENSIFDDEASAKAFMNKLVAQGKAVKIKLSKSGADSKTKDGGISYMKYSQMKRDAEDDLKEATKKNDQAGIKEAKEILKEIEQDWEESVAENRDSADVFTQDPKKMKDNYPVAIREVIQVSKEKGRSVEEAEAQQIVYAMVEKGLLRDLAVEAEIKKAVREYIKDSKVKDASDLQNKVSELRKEIADFKKAGNTKDAEAAQKELNDILKEVKMEDYEPTNPKNITAARKLSEAQGKAATGDVKIKDADMHREYSGFEVLNMKTKMKRVYPYIKGKDSRDVEEKAIKEEMSNTGEPRSNFTISGLIRR